MPYTKLTKSAINEIKRKGNSLVKDVCNYILNEWSNYDDKRNIFTDVLNYGCQSGMVGHLIYYSDTTKYYEKHKKQINDLLQETIKGTCCDCKGLFGDKWDEDDPLVLETQNQNLLAWFGFEETMRNIGLKFKELEQAL